MWQFRNKGLHSLTGTTSLASRHSLYYQTSKEKRIRTDDIDWSSYHLFSKQYTLTKLQSSSITDKKLWLYEVSLACKKYVDPNNANIHQAISQRNQMQYFLITNGPLLSIIPRKRPIATQNNHISDEEQHAAAILFYGPPVKRAWVTAPVTTTDNLLQRTLFAAL